MRVLLSVVLTLQQQRRRRDDKDKKGKGNMQHATWAVLTAEGAT
jgi:hypothetical protein